MSFLSGLLELAKGLSGIEKQLRRIADCQERQVSGRGGFQTFYEDHSTDGSSISYVDDEHMAAVEQAQLAYLGRTGIVLPPGEPPPSPKER